MEPDDEQPEIRQIVESTPQERSRSAGSPAVPEHLGSPASAPDHGPVLIEPQVMCANHATVAAVRRCRYCRAAICETCTFAFPGELYLCPACATKPPVAVTEKRRKYLVWSYVGASVTTVSIALAVTLGARAGSGTGAEAETTNMLLGWLFIGGLILGLVCGALARPRGQPSPGAVRGALIWNWVNAGIVILLMIIGLVTK